MLRITEVDSEQRRTLVLEGRLTEPWLAELARTWEGVRRQLDRREVVIDLKDVTLISEEGETLLFQMMGEGAQFNCCRGVLTKHILLRLARRVERENRVREVQGCRG